MANGESGSGSVKVQTCGLCTRKKIVHGKDGDLWVCLKCDKG